MTTNNQQDILDYFSQNFETVTNQYRIEQEQQIDYAHIRQTVIKLANKIATSEQTDINHALIGMCALFQTGAYLKSVTNRKIRVAGKEFTKKSLVYSAELTECKYTLRTLARYLNKIIVQIGYKYGIPGHLYSRFKIENANLIANNTPQDNLILSVYCTDFQIENPDTPPIVREFLVNREKTRKTNNKSK